MFYGWLIVAIAMLVAFLGAGLNNISMAVVLKPLSEDLGWSRTTTAGAIAAGNLLGGLLAPGFGRLADRLGPRLLVPAGAATVGILVGLISLVTEPWQFYAAYLPARALSETLLAGVVPLTAVTNWFYLQRPRAMGLVIMAVPLGSATMALSYQVIISHAGWRPIFVTLGVLLCGLAVLPPALLLRKQPEDLGLLPDGAPPAGAATRRPPAGGASDPPAAEPSWEPGAAVRTAALWLIVVGWMIATLSMGGVAFHMVAFFTDRQLSADLAAGALSLFALSGALGSAVWGVLAERVAPRVLGLAAMLVAAASVLVLLQVGSPLLAYGAALALGVSARGSGVLTQVLIARYYGRRSFGAISGFGEPFAKAGLGLGPLVAAAAFDLTGSYQGVFSLFSGLFALAGMLVFLARRPRRPPGGG